MDPEEQQAVSVEVARKVRIADGTGKTVYEMENRNGDVSIRKVTTSTKRASVKFSDLKDAVALLSD